MNGSVSGLTEGTTLASAGRDFMSEEQTVTLQDGQESAVISIDIFDVCMRVCFDYCCT